MATVTLPVPRKALGTYQALKSPDGVAWSVVAHTLDSTKNEITVDIDAGDLVMLSMTAFAKQTKPSTNKPVLNGEAGVGGVFVTFDYRPISGNSLQESLTGKIGVSDYGSNPSYQNLIVEKHVLSGNGLLGGFTGWGWDVVTHRNMDLAAPQNNSPAVKALPYQISDNGQCSIGVQANELTFDLKVPVITDTTSTMRTDKGNVYIGLGGLLNGVALQGTSYNAAMDVSGIGYSDGKLIVAATGKELDTGLRVYTGNGWGDDSTMKITADGSDTFVDLNGNIQLSASHELSLPIGWTHNRARVGTQVAGVDL